MRLGDYRILSELGRGASARVFKASAPDGRLVALKVLSRTQRAESYARFEREQKLLETLGEAEGFVPLLASGESEQGPFFAMPLLEGGTLRDRLARRRLEIEEVVQLGRSLAVAIGWAHERGIVHRDLKPENVLFTKAGRPLVADLGIAKHFGEAVSSESLTEQGAFLGTPAYMAPEQMDCSKTVGARADVFSLGAILYECLVGRAPFAAPTLQETVARVTAGRYTRLLEARPDAPLYLVHPIEIALNSNPEYRYEDGFAFAHSLGARLPQSARLQPTVREEPKPPRSSRPWRWAALLVVPCVACAVWGLRGFASATPPPVVERRAPSKRTPPTPPRAAPLRPGWFGEPLPDALRLSVDRPIYLLDTKKGLTLELVYVPPGEFFMGAINGGPIEKPLHPHAIPYGYYIGRTEVTWDEYRAFCTATNRMEPAPPSWSPSGSEPVVNVSWDDANAFCAWAGASLPWEAEWEKAARGSDDTRQFPWGEEWDPARANIQGSRTMPVGSFPGGASPYGALDMAGNVFEWCADWFDPSIYQAYSAGQLEPPRSGTTRVLRGGAWNKPYTNATVCFRATFSPERRLDWLGFRICLSVAKKTP